MQAPAHVIHGDVLSVLSEMEDNRFHAVLCDPPYGLSEPLHGEGAAAVLAQWIAEGEQVRPKKGAKKGFMGAQWDSFVPSPRVWAEVLRVTRPGGYLLAFAGSRTSGWMEISLMLAGWEVLDTIVYMYAEGFPKGGNVGKRVDDLLGAERQVAGRSARHVSGKPQQRTEGLAGSPTFAESVGMGMWDTDPATGEGAIWDDWSTTLKPAHEPVIVARRPLSEKSVAANLLKWRTGAMNIGACRVGEDGGTTKGSFPRGKSQGVYGDGINGACEVVDLGKGRWPANLMLTHSEACGDECAEGCPVRLLDEQGGERKSGSRAAGVRSGLGYHGATGDGGPAVVGSSGGASRFFFCAKASPADRNEGCSHLPEVEWDNTSAPDPDRGNRKPPTSRNAHPTVKPVPLIRELARLVTPQPVAGWTKDGETWRWEDRPPGEVLVPFAGSGSEVVACALEGLRAVGIEREAEYHATAEARVAHALHLVAEGRCPKHWRRRGE